VKRTGLVSNDREQVAADAGRVRLGHAQDRRGADRRVDRVSPFPEHVEAG
jgi:hypothetical protein